uniref:Uncharacterized protein n=1 Tax=Siphoviridae sp. ct8HH20 TaxID=2825359 RepID=A0A8S5Q763_9CAUD|nr:MAG TPA: hypothetical protein [Siphoviridae sp. ct8HH20]
MSYSFNAIHVMPPMILEKTHKIIIDKLENSLYNEFRI